MVWCCGTFALTNPPSCTRDANRCGILHSSFKWYPWLWVCLRCTAQLSTLCWSCTRKLWEHKLNLIGKRIFEKGSNRFVKIWRATSKAIQEFNSTVTEGRSSLRHQVADWNPRKTLHVSTHKVITYYIRTVHYSLACAKLHRHSWGCPLITSPGFHVRVKPVSFY